MQCFPVVSFFYAIQVALAFDFVDEIIKCDLPSGSFMRCCFFDTTLQMKIASHFPKFDFGVPGLPKQRRYAS